MTKIFNEEEKRKKYQQMRLIDNAIMNIAFKDNKEAVGLLVRAILGKKDLEIQEAKVQQVEGNSVNRSVIFDIIAKDKDGSIYNVEMQKCPNKATAERARYHSSMLDQKVLLSGQSFTKLPHTYVIFLTEGFVFGEKQRVIKIKRYMEHNKREFNDGTTIIYVNAQCQDDSELGKVLHDIMCRNSEDIYSQVFKDALDYAKEKENEDMFIEGYCFNEDEIFKQGISLGKSQGLVEGKSQGIVEGKFQAKLDTASNLLKMNFSISDISKATGLSIGEIEKLKK